MKLKSSIKSGRARKRRRILQDDDDVALRIEPSRKSSAVQRVLHPTRIQQQRQPEKLTPITKPTRQIPGQTRPLAVSPVDSTALSSIPEHAEVADFVTQTPLKEQKEYDRDEVGRLVTFFGSEKHSIRIYKRLLPFNIGRHRSAHFVLNREHVSNIHGSLHVTENDTNDDLVIYQDRSTNGTIWNDRVFLMKNTVILSDGDTLSISNQVFTYTQKVKHDNRLSLHRTGFDFSDYDYNRYRITNRTLGTGAFATVFVAVNCKTRLQAACKIMRLKDVMKNTAKTNVMREIELLQQVNHPNICSLQECVSDANNIYVFLDLLMGGDLHNYLVQRNHLEGAETKFISFQILKGLQYLHDNGVGYRDIKLENIVLRDHGPFPHVLISDFGAAYCYQNETAQRSIDIVGTIDYWAPEMFMRDYDARSLDMYGFGCCIYMLLTGTLPFERPEVCSDNEDEDEDGCMSDNTPTRIERIVLSTDFNRDPSSSDVRALTALRPDLHGHLDASELALSAAIMNMNLRLESHPILKFVDKNAIDVIRNLIADERCRYTAEETLQHPWFQNHLKELQTVYRKNVEPYTNAQHT